MSDLLGCPFCGGTAYLTPVHIGTRHERTAVGCAPCDLSFVEDTDEAATAAWNRRAAPVVTDDAVERVAKALHHYQYNGKIPWNKEMPHVQEAYRHEANAVLAALEGRDG